MPPMKNTPQKSIQVSMKEAKKNMLDMGDDFGILPGKEAWNLLSRKEAGILGIIQEVWKTDIWGCRDIRGANIQE